MNIAVVGGGYVGTATLEALKGKACLTLVDCDPSKLIGHGIGFALSIEPADSFDIVVVCVPTNLNTQGELDTRLVEFVCSRAPSTASIIIRSTLPIGFTDALSARLSRPIVYIPEFLREHTHLHDALHPSRVVIGGRSGSVQAFVDLLPAAPRYWVSTIEAEAIKLCSNAYLAMRLEFFNTVKDLCQASDAHLESVIGGICADPRIGDHYNDPRGFYSGKCLPKDTRQLASSLYAMGIDAGAIKATDDRNTHRLRAHGVSL